MFFYHQVDSYYERVPGLQAQVLDIVRNAFHLKIAPQPIPPDTLVIHIRSGDIFGPNPHSGYVQPPLCWYQVCVMHHRSLFKKISVLIVCEDLKNPCILGVQHFCRKVGIPVTIQSGSLDEDFSCLMGATALVGARSSFTGPVKELSCNLQYFYEYKHEYVKPGTYIEIGEWANTPEQRKQMYILPMEALALPEDFSTLILHRPLWSRSNRETDLV